MREIKFRLWNGQKMTPNEVLNIFTKNLNKLNGENYCVMQYTGLKDKNGKEIYEGDYINIFFEDGRNYGKGPITFVRGGFQCCDMVLQDIYSENLNTEVIGNVHENPELLK